MKKVLEICLFTYVLFNFLTTSAFAALTYGWWDDSHPRATHQQWTFAQTEVFVDDVDPSYDYYAVPTVKNNPGPAIAHIEPGAVYDPVNEQFTGEFISLMLEIDNFEDPLDFKEIYVALDYNGDLGVPGVQGFDGGTPYDVIQIDPRNADFAFKIMPNPEKEHIHFDITGVTASAILREVIVDTICIPEPMTICLLGFGGLLVISSRKRNMRRYF